MSRTSAPSNQCMVGQAPPNGGPSKGFRGGHLNRLPRLVLLSAVLGAALGVAAPAASREPTGLGFSLSGGWNMGTQKWQHVDSGGLLGGAVSFESGYFLTPVLSVHHVWLASDAGSADVGEPLGIVDVQSSLRALAFLLGPAVDMGPVRLTAGVGLYWLMVESTVDRVTIDPTTLVLGYAVTAEGWIWRWDWGQLGAFAMANFLAEAQIAYFGGGLTLRVDLGLTP